MRSFGLLIVLVGGLLSVWVSSGYRGEEEAILQRTPAHLGEPRAPLPSVSPSNVERLAPESAEVEEDRLGASPPAEPEAAGGIYFGLDERRFAPTLESCVEWMATVANSYPEHVRAVWDVDPKFREAWATTCEFRALKDVVSRYDEDQLERYQMHERRESLLDYIGPGGRAALWRLAPDRAALYEALDSYEAELQNLLWMAGEDATYAPNPETLERLFDVLRESDPLSQAGLYMVRRISSEASK